MSVASPADILTMAEAVAHCGVASSTLRSAVWRGGLAPAEDREGMTSQPLHFTRGALDAWLERQERPDGWLDMRQAAEYCQVSYSALLEARRSGALPCVRWVPPSGGLAHIFNPADLDAWKAGQSLVDPATLALAERMREEARARDRARKNAQRRARARAASQKRDASKQLCINCRHCVKSPRPGFYACALDCWPTRGSPHRDLTQVRGLKALWAEDCRYFVLWCEQP